MKLYYIPLVLLVGSCTKNTETVNPNLAKEIEGIYENTYNIAVLGKQGLSTDTIMAISENLAKVKNGNTIFYLDLQKAENGTIFNIQPFYSKNVYYTGNKQVTNIEGKYDGIIYNTKKIAYSLKSTQNNNSLIIEFLGTKK